MRAPSTSWPHDGRSGFALLSCHVEMAGGVHGCGRLRDSRLDDALGLEGRRPDDQQTEWTELRAFEVIPADARKRDGCSTLFDMREIRWLLGPDLRETLHYSRYEAAR